RVVRWRLLVGVSLLIATSVPIILIARPEILARVRGWLGAPVVVPNVTLREKPDVFLPEGYRPEPEEGAEIVSLSKDRKVYNRIAYVLPDNKTRIIFLLIPQASDKDPPPFYIMQDKVSNKLLGAFAEANPKA